MASINLNTNPYYDDFDASKNYVKILFKPSYAVQARELTQLQTALQKQISRFGAHVFKDGSVVLGGNTSTSFSNWIDVETGDVSAANGKTIRGLNSGATGKVFSVVQLTTTTGRVYFNYTSGATLEQGEVVEDSSTETELFSIVDVEEFSGFAQVFSIAESVFFVKEHFVYCEPQTIVLSNNLDPITKKVGLKITESIVSSTEDDTLLDPAQGSYNFAAPGADRLAIAVDLVAYDYTPEDQTADTLGEFIELSRFEAGDLIYQVTSASYSELENTLARRTYDESGDYTVRAFGLKVVPHKFGDSNKLSLAIEPGKAYVKGYEFETIATTYTDLEKARDFATRQNSATQVDFGSYVIVSGFTVSSGSIFDFNANSPVVLRNASNATIGTANVKAVQSHTATSYRVYLFNVSMTGSWANVRTVYDSVSKVSCTIDLAAPEYASGVRLVAQDRTPLVVPLPKANIKTLKTSANGGLSETSYRAFKTVNADFTSGVATITPGSGEEFPSVKEEEYLVMLSNGTVKPVNLIGGTATSRTVTLVDTTVSQAGARVFLPVNVQVAIERQKVLQNNFTVTKSVSTNKISLDKSDCYKLISVIAKDTAPTPSPDLDVTALFDFNNGQKDDMYDHGWIQLKTGASIPAAYDNLAITFSYFTQSTANGFFSVDSYPGIPYEDIPSFTSSSGETYNLRDCLDFRPRRADNATTYAGSYFPVVGDVVTADYEYYLSRIDKLVLTKERKFSVVKGLPAEVPTIPADLYDAMTLYVINVPAYTEDASLVSTSYVDNKRYTMRDIGKIDRRVERLENYTVLSLLEQESKDEVIYDAIGQERFKNGIIADSFSGHGIGDVANPEYSCSINPEERILRPRFSPQSFNYVVSALNGARKEKDLISLPYTTEVLVEQPYATRSVNLNPYQVFMWNGQVDLNPATDTWVDVTTRPDVIVNMNGDNDVYTTLVDNVENPASVGVRWNDWQTVGRGVAIEDNFTTNITSNISSVGGKILEQTTRTLVNNQVTTTTDYLQRIGLEVSTSSVKTVSRDLGTRVVDTSIVPYIRSRVVKFAAKKLKPLTKLLATFDGVDVSDYCTPAVEVVLANNSANKSAEKIRTVDGLKVASVVMTRSNRAFVVMDEGSTTFSVGEALQWLVGGVWITNSSVQSVIIYDSLQTNEKGDVAGTFYIPNTSTLKFRTGERRFRLTDAVGSTAGTAAEAKYVASGLSQSTERTIVATRVATQSINPVSEVSTTSVESSRNIVVSVTNAVTDLTPPPPTKPILLGCDASERGNGNQVVSREYTLDLGTGTGIAGISYQAYSVPDRYTIIWDGKVYTTGFVGDSSYNSTLNKLGYPNVEGAGSGNLTFNKNRDHPRTARLIVDGPIKGTGWNFRVRCPGALGGTPPLIPDAAVSASLSLSSAFTVRSRAAGTLGSASTVWQGNSAVGTNIEYTLQSVTSNVAGITVSLPTNRVRSKGNELTGITVNTNGYVGNFTLTATWVTTNVAIPVALRTITTTANSRVVLAPVVTVRGSGGRSDPVAQTFFVDAAQYPNGLFIKKLDLFFKTKSDTLPVEVQIRPTVNGYPSSNTVMPFGSVTLDAEEIVTSADGSLATTFEFENIIHLAPGEYSFVAITDTDEYEIFTSRLGEFSINNPTERVTRQPTLGSMFKSQNAATWTPEQEEDVKFVLHKCVFTPGTSTAVVFDTDTATLKGAVDYDLFYTMGEVVDFADTNISYDFKAGGSWIGYQLGSNVALDTRKTITSTTGSSLQFRTTLTTNDANVTPIVDLNRLSSVLVKNIVNNDAVGENGAVGGNALSKYITRRAKLASGMEATDLKAFLLARLPAGTSIKVYYKASAVGDTLFDDNVYTEMTLESADPYTDGGFVSYKYKTPTELALPTGDRFDTYAIKIVMLSSNPTQVPEVKNLRVIALDD